MDFEKQVEQQLIQNGYHIFYKNLNIYYNNYNIAELDIICADFILEIKSGKCLKSNGIYKLFSHNILPNNFTYYFYFPLYSSSEIQEFNQSFANNHYKVIYINSLQDIYKQYPPSLNIHIESQAQFIRLLTLSDKVLHSLNTISIDLSTYTKTISSLDYKTKHIQGILKNIVRINKLEQIKHHIIITEHKPSSHFIIEKKQICKKYIMKKFEPIHIPIYYRYDVFERCKLIHDIELNFPCNNLP